jgi:imidazolonepropionase-like amidohydrolase
MKYLIKNVEIDPVVKEKITGDVLIDNGIIKKIDNDIVEKVDEVIDGKKALLLPGFIDAHSHIGLNPEGYGFEYDDTNESSEPNTADVRAVDGFTTSDKSIKEGARGGVLIYCVLPGSSNPIGGLGFIAKYSKSNLVSDFILRYDSCIKMATGENPKRCFSEKDKSPSTRMGIASIIRNYLFDGKNYIEKKKKSQKENKVFAEYDNKMEIAQKILGRELPVRIHCHRAEDILFAIRLKEEFGIRVSIEHCTDLIKVQDEVKKSNVPVMLGPVMSNRSKVELMDMTYLSYKTAIDREIPFSCISDHPVFPVETLRLQAGMAINYGADEREMLKSLTIYPARILNISEEYGSIEIGKKDNLCLWNGSPFDSRSKVVWNNIDGFIN